VSGPQIAWLADGRRLHLNHGPIDLIIETFGRQSERRAAHDAAIGRFRTILDELVSELPELRRSAGAAPRTFAGPTARRMEAAVQKFHPEFITPMAAVAGSVADEMMAAMLAAATLDKAYVNDGGDIALHVRGDATIARHRDKRLARPQLFPRHRRCRHRSRRKCRRGRCRRNDDRQCGRPARPSCDHQESG
jgi:ApbE superfamily uncharacterized protein (UPF0280 family)